MVGKVLLLLLGLWTIPSPRQLLRTFSDHTGIPALVVVAVLLVLGFRLLKRTSRFLLQVALAAAALFAATELGWIRW